MGEDLKGITVAVRVSASLALPGKAAPLAVAALVARVIC
jgi:hypothetical protein